ncbi:MAG: hypothetical protein IJL87_10750 [Clostridia bacterium]|nr:hypothetical protein [Clostridia bacterium]
MIYLYIAAAILLTVFLCNAVMTYIERGKYPFPGRTVSFDDEDIHLFACGNAENQKVIILHDCAECAPAVQHFELAQKLSEKYRVIIAERCGYGWSGDTYAKRTAEDIVYEYRTALQGAGENGEQYILVAFGAANEFAKYWSENFSDEVARVAGVESKTAKNYGKVCNALIAAAREMGFLRIYNLFALKDAPDFGGNKKAYIALANSRTMSAPMREELENFASVSSENLKPEEELIKELLG